MMMMLTRPAVAALAATLLLAAPARAELLRVEIKTLGMD
jgi:hypothetical protein